MSGSPLWQIQQQRLGQTQTAAPPPPTVLPIGYDNNVYQPTTYQGAYGDRPSGAGRQFYQPIFAQNYSSMPQSYGNPMAISQYNPYAAQQQSYYNPYGQYGQQMSPYSQPQQYGGGKGGGGMQAAPSGGGKGGAQVAGMGMAKGGLTSLR